MRRTQTVRFCKLISVLWVLSVVLSLRVLADDGIDAVLTNVNQLATIFSNPPGDFPLVLPLETAPTNGFPQWWVSTADPFWRTDRGIPIWWTDFGQLPTNFTVLRDYQSTTNGSGIEVWPLKLIRYEDTGAVSVQVPANSTELLSFSSPPNYQPDSLYERVLRGWVALGIFSNWQSYDDLVAQYPDLAPPRLILPLWIADINNMPVCETNEDASQGSMVSISEDDEIQFDSLSSSCTITSLIQRFFITGIGMDTNRYTTIRWQSCPIFRYIAYSTDQLSTNTGWTSQAYVWGQVNASATSWTDTTTTNASVTQRFYRVRRIFGSPIAAGELHGLALGPFGNLWAWGDNTHGELGDGAVSSQSSPKPIGPPVCMGISNAVSVSACGDFSVALDANGTVWTWGGNQWGQLGNGLSVTNDYPTPSPITGVSNVVAVAAGAYHTLALRADGTVWAWGSNGNGQLGNGDTLSANTPVQSVGLTQIVAVAAGESHSVALQQGGTVWTWGAGGGGRLGNGGITDLLVPASLTGISNVIAITAGVYHTIALTSDGTVWTWGGIAMGELGRTNYVDSNSCSCAVSPGQVSGLSNVVAIAGGNEFTLAATSNGQVYAWGDNSVGQLGVGSGVGSTNRPMLVPGISNVVLVSANAVGDSSGAHSLAVSVAQGATNYWSWGRNLSGEVGNGGTNSIAYTPEVLHFCPVCTGCIQFDTNGTFTAPCTGKLRLYFNDSNDIDNSGDYTVTVSNVGITNVPSGDASGVVIGTIYNGFNYSYTATGFITWDAGNPSHVSNAAGRDHNGVLIDCDAKYGSTNGTGVARNGFPCPSSICYSLVGKIE